MTQAIHLLEGVRELPDELRTGHWFNDLQHGMFVVLFRNILTALREGRPGMADKVMDVTTVYLHTHFLVEEEGLAFTLSRGGAETEDVTEHQRIHLKVLAGWKRDVMMPARAGTLTGLALRDAVAHYYDAVIKHIRHSDQPAYGHAKERDDLNRSEICHLSHSGLPLSPFMPGSVPLVRQLDREAVLLLRPGSLPAAAYGPGKSLQLLDGSGLCLEPGSLRSKVAATGTIQSIALAA